MSTHENELPDEFVGLFPADAIWTTGGGRRLVGRDEITTYRRDLLDFALWAVP